jgi:hypothetical protein
MEFEAVTIQPLEGREQINFSSDEFFRKARSAKPIEDDTHYQRVAGELKRAKAFIKETEKTCRPRIKQVADLKASLLADMNSLIASAKESVPVFSGLLVEYDNKLEAKRQEEQARLERERIKRESDARASEEKRKLETALELEKEGRSDEAEQVLNQPDRQAPEPENVAVVQEKPKIAGLSYREKWKAEQTLDIDSVDPRFVKMVFDQDMANAYAKSNKEGAKAKGIRFYCEKIAVNRA